MQTENTMNNNLFTSSNSTKNLPSITIIEKEYKDKIEKLKKPKSWLRFVISTGIIFTSLFLVSLVATHIITGAVALIVAGITVVLGIYGYKAIKTYDPVIQQKMKNNAIKKMIEEAQKRKIETLSQYIQDLDNYLKHAKAMKTKTNMLIEKYKNDYEQNKSDDYLANEYKKLIEKTKKTAEDIDKIVIASKKKKEDFEKMLKIARSKYDYIKETKDIVDFLQNSENELDKLLVDESLNQLEKEFQEISSAIRTIANDIDEEDKK